MKQKSSATKKPDDRCPHRMCDGSGWRDTSDEDDYRDKCLCRIEYEADQLLDFNRENNGS